MKHFTNKALRYFLSALLIFLLFTLIGQTIAIAFYAALAIASAGGVVYLITRASDDPKNNRST